MRHAHKGQRRRIAWLCVNTFHLAWQLTSPGRASKQHRNLFIHKNFPLLLALLRADSLASLGHPQKMDVNNPYLEMWQDLTGQRKES